MENTTILAFIAALLAASLGLVVVWYDRRSLASWTFFLGMGLLAAESICLGLAADASLPDDMVYWQNRGLTILSLLPATWLCFSLTFARGNSGEFLRRWRFPLALAFLAPVSLSFAAGAKFIVSMSSTGPHWVLRLSWFGVALHIVFLVVLVLCLMNFERTFRASVGTMRWRIKFMLIGLGILFAVRAYTSAQVLLFHSLDLSLQFMNSGALLLGCLLIARWFKRAGHLNVSVYPSHSVIHGSLTIILAGIYLLIVGLFAKLVAFIGGDSSFALKTFVLLLSLVLLTILLLSEKVRLHTRRFVSRHFQRPQYDYRSVWRAFTEATARHVEQPDVCSVVARLLSEIFQALSVTVWLVDDRAQNVTFAASTFLSSAEAFRLPIDSSEMAQALAGLRAHPAPLDIDSSREVWAVLLRRLHPDEFRKGGNRLCVPLMAAGELLGLVTMGDRVGGIPYSLQDFDLLKAVGDQAAANLLNIKLSQKLAQAKQLEAFQSMSAFFVHDLKNTASTLSLMLQNLPVHFNDPAFREDALRGVSKTVTRINDLIARLGLLRQELSTERVDADLNELVNKVLEGNLSFADGRAELHKQLNPLPKLRLDPAQIQNVITNLVFNARDAVSPGGNIKVETSQQNGWAVLAVADDGCGMTPEFVQHSLFRPFQTTKKQGVGIGMFQTRMIVEAHNGKIEVESEPGKGTAFRVLLPLAAPA